MAHFAELDENDIVLRVIVVSNEVCPDPAPDNEQQGVDFLKNIGLGDRWKQTSYHGTFRKQYAGIGYKYDAMSDVFIAPQPYPSWLLNDNFDWVAPVAYPSDGARYEWEEETESWVAVSAG